MKKVVPVVLCLVALGLSTTAQEPVVTTNPGPRPPQRVVTAAQINGVYRYDRNDFRVLALGRHKLKVQFNGEWMTRAGYPNIGEAIGQAIIEGSVATFIPGDTTQCKITMTFLPNNRMVVEQEGLDAECGFGHNVMARGSYRRVMAQHTDPEAAAQQGRLSDRLAHARLGAAHHPLHLDPGAALEPAHATPRLTSRPVGLGLERLEVLLKRLHLPLEIRHHLSPLRASARRRRRTLARRSEAQRAHLVPEALDVLELDLLVASDQIRQPRDLDRPLVAFRRETDERLLDEGAVLAG